MIDTRNASVENGSLMDCTLALLADAANISQEGKLNVLGAFANISTQRVPTTHPEMSLVLRFEASPAKAGQTKNLDVVLMDEDGNTSGGRLQANFVVPAPKQPGQRIRLHSIMRLQGTRFERAGNYRIAILVNGESKAEVPLSVTVIQAEEKQDDAGD